MTPLADPNPHAARSLSQAWRNAIAIGGAFFISPVALLALVLVAASVFPLFMLALPLMAGAWAPAGRGAPVPAGAAQPWRPAVVG